MSEVLKDIPDPTDEMVKNEHTSMTLDLIHGSRDTIGVCLFVCGGAIGFVVVVVFAMYLIVDIFYLMVATLEPELYHIDFT